jgi:hypothetical protein
LARRIIRREPHAKTRGKRESHAKTPRRKGKKTREEKQAEKNPAWRSHNELLLLSDPMISVAKGGHDRTNADLYPFLPFASLRLGVRFLFSLASWREVLFFLAPWREIYSGTSNR